MNVTRAHMTRSQNARAAPAHAQDAHRIKVSLGRETIAGAPFVANSCRFGHCVHPAAPNCVHIVQDIGCGCTAARRKRYLEMAPSSSRGPRSSENAGLVSGGDPQPARSIIASRGRSCTLLSLRMRLARAAARSDSAISVKYACSGEAAKL